MKVLLINPPARELKWEDVVVPPLGLAYLASAIAQDGHTVKILDAFAQGLGWNEFEEEVKKEKADLIGVGGMTPIIDSTLRAIKICRAYTQTIVMGGPHISAYGQDFFKDCPELHFGLIGEGEEGFRLLLRRLEKARDPWDVPGLLGPKMSNPPAPFIQDLDTIPFPARHLLPNASYRYALWPGEKITTLITSRGCPYQCIFCDKSIFGAKWRARSARNVVDELEEIVKDFGIRSMIIYDDLFTLDKRRVLEICQGILDRGLKIKWKCEGRVDRVDAEMLAEMKKAGCSVIAYGVESGNEGSLAYLRKGISLAQIRQAFSLTHQAGIKPMAYFILGIPVETFEQSLQTIRLAKELRPDYAQFSILSPYRGTDLFREAKAKNWYQEVNAQNPYDKDAKRPVIISENWSEEALKGILRLAHKEFYFRPAYALRKLTGVRNFRQMRSLWGVGCRLLRWYFSKGGAC